MIFSLSVTILRFFILITQAFTDSLLRRIRRTVILRLCRKQCIVIFHHGLHVIFIHVVTELRPSIYRVMEARIIAAVSGMSGRRLSYGRLR